MFGWDKGQTDTDAIYAQKHLTCPNVPHNPETWWSHFMSYPTFTALIVPNENMTRDESASWIQSFTKICNFTKNNMVEGAICATTYFEVSQELIATMILAGKLFKPLPARTSAEFGNKTSELLHTAAPSEENVTEADSASVLEVTQDNVTTNSAEVPAKPDAASRPSVMISSVLTALAAAAFALAAGDVLLRYMTPSSRTTERSMTEESESSDTPLTGGAARELEAYPGNDKVGP